MKAKTDPFFKVMLRTERGAKWENWTVYRDLDDAILAAEGLITSDLGELSVRRYANGRQRTESSLITCE